MLLVTIAIPGTPPVLPSSLAGTSPAESPPLRAPGTRFAEQAAHQPAAHRGVKCISIGTGAPRRSSYSPSSRHDRCRGQRQHGRDRMIAALTGPAMLSCTL